MNDNGAADRKTPPKSKIERTHPWLDEDGNLAFEHRKKSDGTWSYRHPVEGKKCPEHPEAKPFGRWCYRKPEVARGLLWDLTDLCDALDNGDGVGWFAGEKDAKAGKSAKLHPACTSVHQGEANGTYPEQAELFRDTASVVTIYMDDDKTGHKNGLDRYGSLLGVELPADQIALRLPAEGSNDVSDHLGSATARANGFREISPDELRALVPEDPDEEDNEDAEDGADLLEQAHAALRAVGSKPASSGQDWTCPNPGHKKGREKTPSFGVTIGRNGSLLFQCQTCMPEAGTPAHKRWHAKIIKVLGLQPAHTKGKGKPEKETVSQVLIRMALEDYRLGMSTEGKPFAVRRDGGSIVRFFDRGNGEFGHNLAREYYRATKKAPGSSAMAEAIGVLYGFALELDPEEIQIRVGVIEGGETVGKEIAIDIGDSTERAIVVGPEGWEIRDRAPVLFRRTKATLPFPEPVQGVGIETLRELLNLSSADFDLVVAYLVAAFIPDIQHPILVMTGAQGTGKSDATRMLSMLMDPSSVPLRKKPKDELAWSVTSYASWAICLENMSWIPEWFSDDLCSAVTGAGDIERQFHTNDDIRIRSIRRVIMINGIDPGGIRLDLADRMFAIRLQKIRKRLNESAVEAKFAAMAPGLFGALLDLLVEVRKVQLSGRNLVEYEGRMGDFAMVARAVDEVRGSSSFERFTALRDEGLLSITEDDPITSVMLNFLNKRPGQSWEGTPSNLYAFLDGELDTGKPSGWPKTPRSLSQALTRLEPGWLAIGIKIQRMRVNERTLKLSIVQPASSKS